MHEEFLHFYFRSLYLETYIAASSNFQEMELMYYKYQIPLHIFMVFCLIFIISSHTPNSFCEMIAIPNNFFEKILFEHLKLLYCLN